MKVEVIDNMDFSEYLDLERLSCSALKNFQKSPAYYMQQQAIQKEPTKAMKLGTMIHTWMLENTTFHNTYFPIPKLDKRTKEGKAAFASYSEAANGRELIEESLIENFSRLPVRTDTRNEVTVLWEWEGIPCKSRFDMLHEDGVEDLKSIADIFKISRDFHKFGYHLQAGFYSQAYFHAFGKWPEFFNFTFVSTEAAYFDMVTCPISFGYMEQGRMECRELLLAFKECKKTGKYPGISSFEIDSPSWY